MYGHEGAIKIAVLGDDFKEVIEFNLLYDFTRPKVEVFLNNGEKFPLCFVRRAVVEHGD